MCASVNVSLCVYVCILVCVCVSANFHSGGNEHFVIPGYGPHAAVSAAIPARCHPEKENGTDLGEYPACSGSTHLAAVS